MILFSWNTKLNYISLRKLSVLSLWVFHDVAVSLHYRGLLQLPGLWTAASSHRGPGPSPSQIAGPDTDFRRPLPFQLIVTNKDEMRMKSSDISPCSIAGAPVFRLSKDIYKNFQFSVHSTVCGICYSYVSANCSIVQFVSHAYCKSHHRLCFVK